MSEKKWYSVFCCGNKVEDSEVGSRAAGAAGRAKSSKRKRFTSSGHDDAPINAKLIQIVCPTNQKLKWRPKHIQDGSPLQIAPLNELWWTTWNSVLNSDPMTYIYGRRNRKSNGYLFIHGVKQGVNPRLKLRVGKTPTHDNISPKDNRVFRYKRLKHTKFHMLQHVVTGLFVAKKGKKLVLVDENEADDWLLEQKID